MNKALIIFVGGFAAGFAAGILFAPDIGSETREKISRTSRDLLDTLMQKAEDGLDVLRGLRKDFKTNTSDLAEVLSD